MSCFPCHVTRVIVPQSPVWTACQSQLCGECGATMAIHADEHPHPHALCSGYVSDAFTSAMPSAPPQEETPHAE